MPQHLITVGEAINPAMDERVKDFALTLLADVPTDSDRSASLHFMGVILALGRAYGTTAMMLCNGNEEKTGELMTNVYHMHMKMFAGVEPPDHLIARSN